jgi:hypothetical protein
MKTWASQEKHSTTKGGSKGNDYHNAVVDDFCRFACTSANDICRTQVIERYSLSSRASLT